MTCEHIPPDYFSSYPDLIQKLTHSHTRFNDLRRSENVEETDDLHIHTKIYFLCEKREKNQAVLMLCYDADTNLLFFTPSESLCGCFTRI